MSRSLRGVSVVALVIAAAACSSNEGATRVGVVGTDSGCEPASAEVKAGKVVLEFNNTASQINELYVLRADETVVGEVENVVTGTTRDLTVDVVAGDYILECKPGQQGAGIRGAFRAVGDGGSKVAAPSETISVVAKEYSFAPPADMKIEAGETIKFEMLNQGTMEHEMEVFGPDGTAIGEVGPTGAGKTGTVTLTLSKAGTYNFVCGIKDKKTGIEHQAQGMASKFTVA